MKKSLIKYSFIVILFIVTGAVSWHSYFQDYYQADSVDIHLFPPAINGWFSKDLPMTEREFAILETRNAFVREYRSLEGRTIYMFIVYSQHNRKVSHPPEICYIGGGVNVLDHSKNFLEVSLNNDRIPVNKLFLEKGNTQQVAYYWFKVGGSFVSNYWLQQALIAWKTFIGHPASSALIRISADVGEEGPEAAEKSIKEFCQSAVPLMPQFLP
jgi:EpsI family protein